MYLLALVLVNQLFCHKKVSICVFDKELLLHALISISLDLFISYSFKTILL